MGKKALSCFYPKPFDPNPAMKHGILNKEFAREAYVNEMKVEVVQIDLIVPSQNPWLGYSPDGVVFEGGRPTKLLEIKCLFIGKEKTAEDILQN